MTSRQLFARWKEIVVAVVIAIVMVVLMTSVFPWLAALSGLVLLTVAIAYVTWLPMSDRIAALRKLPRPSLHNRIYIGVPIIVLAVMLLALSQSQIRANWRNAETRALVARDIESASSALKRERIDEALEICNQLDPIANADEQTQIAAIRDRARTIEYAFDIKAANANVAHLVSEGRIHVIKGAIDDAQSALEDALNVELATDFRKAVEFANDIAAIRTKMAIELLDKGDVAKAKEQAQQAISVPSATEFTEARRLIVDICNREVAQLVALARESLAKSNRDEAADVLQRALAIRGATETAEVHKLIASIREAREADANKQVPNAGVKMQELSAYVKDG